MRALLCMCRSLMPGAAHCYAPYASDHVSEQVALRQSMVSKLSPGAADYSHSGLQCESSHSPVWVRPHKCTNEGTWRATASPLMSNTRARMQRAKQKQPRTRPAAVAESIATAMQNACRVSHLLSMRRALNNASAARPVSQDACRFEFLWSTRVTPKLTRTQDCITLRVKRVFVHKNKRMLRWWLYCTQAKKKTCCY